jgi:hypothetical protein
VKTKEHLEKHDRQIAAIRDLVQQGMRLVVETRQDIRALATAQKRTDASLQALIASLRQRPLQRQDRAPVGAERDGSIGCLCGLAG